MNYDKLTLEMADIITFGKYKHKSVAELVREDPGYLIWWRDERLKVDSSWPPIGKEVADLLNQAIKDKKAQRGQRPWEWKPPAATADATTADKPAWPRMKELREAPPEISEDKARELAYAGEWGAW